MALETINYGPRSLQKLAHGYALNIPNAMCRTFGFSPQDKFDINISTSDGTITMKRVESP